MTIQRLLYSGLAAILIFSASGRAADTFASRQTAYHLHPGDTITVEYRYTPEYNTTVSIEPDGATTLPLLGSLKLGGLTLTDASKIVTTKAAERLNDPEVTIGLKDFQKPYYIVGGEVGTPGRFDIRGRVTALQAIEMAGGFKYTARISQVLLIRPVDDVNAKTKIINLKKVLDKRQLDEDVELRAGDMLIVPKSRLGTVEPYIRLVNAGFYLSPSNF